MALLLNAGDTVSRSYSYTQPSPLHPSQPQETGERTGNLFNGNYELAYMANSANAVYYDNISNVRTALIPCKPNTKYTIKRFEGGNRLRVACYATKPTNNTTGDLLYNSNSDTSVTITTLSTAAYLAVYVAEVASASETILTSIVEGETAPTVYEPYGYKIPISSANTTTPVYLGEVETTRKIRKIRLVNPSSRTTTSKGYTRLAFNISEHVAPVFSKGGGYCNIASWQGNYNEIGFVAQEFTMFITQDIPEWGTLEGATEWFNSNEVYVWYILATPETGIVNEPLRKIGDYADTLSYEQAGVSVPTLHGNTVIDVETTLKPSEMYIKYKG